MVSRSAISRTNEPVLASIQRDSRKYERTRLRSDPALPTYRMAPPASLNRYTPAVSGRPAAFSRGSIGANYVRSLEFRFPCNFHHTRAESDSGERLELSKKWNARR